MRYSHGEEMTQRMQGKVVFLTGASEGIGRATAIRLAEEGARMVLCARRPGPLAEVEATIRAQGGAVETLILDVGNIDAYAKAIQEVGQRYGRLDALINNAMSVGYASILDTTIEAWRRD